MTALLDALVNDTGLRSTDVLRVMSRAPLRYKTYEIPKRTGGSRVIAQPAREVKLVQRSFAKLVLVNLPVHACATAYVSGRSILNNAEPHAAASGPILKLDLRDFFPSIKATDWVAYCKRTGCLTEAEDIFLTSHLLFRRVRGARALRLAIGAPTSPILSNILMHQIDEQIFSAVSKDYVTYTRYADDMTFSAVRTGFLNGVMSNVARIIRNTTSPSLDINGDKTTYVTKKFHRTVTGLTLANDGRVTIGRDRKRKISASVHYARQGKLDRSQIRMLSGMLAYVNAVEPGFLAILRKKYGAEIIATIQKTVSIGSRLAPHVAPLAPI